MEQYLNLVWKNYTASRSQHSDENFSDEADDASDLFANNDLHYQIPFWIGVTVISLLLLSAIIGTIRYCLHALSSAHNEADKAALMSPTSPCLSSRIANTSQRQRSKPIVHRLSNNNEKSSSSSPEQFRDHCSNISIVPIIGQHSRSDLNSTRRHRTQFDTENHHYFSPSECRTPIDFRKKVHDIYVLPVSPALSSSSSTTNSAETIRPNSNTMPVRSRRHLSSSGNTHHNSTFHGVKNACFTDSPQPKNRTLPRSQTDTLRRVPPPSQPPPLPPTISQFQHQLLTETLDSGAITLRFCSIEENQMKKTLPPPVPCRTQKPSTLFIGFEELTKQSGQIDFRLPTELSPQSDHSEHAWPNPPESMSTSQLSGPLSIPYDHLIPNIIMHPNSTTTKFFHQYRHGEHSMLTESDT